MCLDADQHACVESPQTPCQQSACCSASMLSVLLLTAVRKTTGIAAVWLAAQRCHLTLYVAHHPLTGNPTSCSVPFRGVLHAGRLLRNS